MQIDVNRKSAKQLLTKASGFLEGYTHTLNPYTGCAFACSYCYVRQMPVALFRSEPWGSWVDVKENAAALLEKELAKARRKGRVTIFMSSATDPYQPSEHKERITRSLLEAMSVQPPDFLFLQTRSPLVKRDADLLELLGDRVRVSMTVETDREDVRRAFTPSAPPIPARMEALRELAARGIPVQATIAPALPSSEQFAERLAGIVERVCIDDYFMGDGSGGRRTARIGVRAIYDALELLDWYSPDAYKRVHEQLLRHFPQERVLVSQQGFLPG
ncbi:SPL family radical SAM protein [Paenibacillus aceris]|uniref:DNA repair photolyase n=1 Tax=Paenibacillus aceris TaxID=869555 RepID=A0ABS4I627_9BACL|nr:radical SAM protein [Paenibacillus aceris]MBP1965871.1 DNA repair photolyase [Paenibacillus aceris]NHW35127.1 radical SAM protein [Paenibacillus aceris]